MRRKKTIAAATTTAAAAIVVAAAAFGGSDRLSRGELRREANGLCAAAEQRVDELTAEQGTETLDRRFVRSVATVYRGTVSDLQALRPPKVDENAYARMVESFDRGVAAVEASSERMPPDAAMSWEDAFGVAAPDLERAGRAAAGLELEACAD